MDLFFEPGEIIDWTRDVIAGFWSRPNRANEKGDPRWAALVFSLPADTAGTGQVLPRLAGVSNVDQPDAVTASLAEHSHPAPSRTLPDYSSPTSGAKA